MTIHPSTGIFSKNAPISDDGSIKLIRVGNRAAYVKDGVTQVIALPIGHDWSDARHVIVIKN